MNLKKYDNKLIQIIDTQNNTFEGLCQYNGKEYNEHGYGKKEDSIQILNIIFYKSTIKQIKEISTFTNPNYDKLEELIVDSDIDFIEDALEYNDIHKERIIKCLKDKNKYTELLEKYDK